MKNFFTKLKQWFSDHKPSKRRLIQLYVALLYNANIKGFVTGRISKAPTKNLCVPGFNCYSCPGAIGSCPLGSLQNALGSSKTSTIAYVFGIIILFGLILGRTICGFLCPMGLVQDLVYKIKSPKAKKSKITEILSYFKYVLLFAFVILIPIAYSKTATLPAFCQYVCPVGTLAGLGLLSSPTNSGELAALGSLFTWKFCLAVLIVIGAIFVYRLFCRFLCPLGAIYSFFCKIAMLGIKLDKQKCIDCGLCIKTCKVDIRRVGDHECIQCGACISVCPTKAISWKGSQFFLLANETDENAVSVEGETVDLKDVVNGQIKLSSTNVTSENGDLTPLETVLVDEQALGKDNATKNDENSAEKPKRGLLYRLRKNKGKGFKIIAVILASVTLVSALIYFNFIREETAASTTLKVGDKLENFEAKEFFSDDGKYSLSEDSGKIVVLNFWYITCAACEAEMPHFGALASDENYKDKVSVVVTHSNDDVQSPEEGIGYDGELPYIEYYAVETKGWGSFYQNIKWIKDLDGQNSIFLKLGGTEFWPMTAIIDEEGTVRFIAQSSVSQEELYAEVDKILEK